MSRGMKWIVLLIAAILVASVRGTRGTSLMKRIREKQNADDSLRGLELGADGWIQVPQPVQDVLMSIDDKLRSLDTFSYTLKLARLDFSLDQLVRRMENIETKLGRLETKFDVRMEKVEEVVVSKDIKEEFSNEHLSRRMENLNEKINNKAAYLDAKMDIKMERVMSKLELLERDLHNSVDDILERLIRTDERHGTVENEMIKKEERMEELSTNVNDLRLYLKEEFLNTITKNFHRLSSEVGSVQEILHIQQNRSEFEAAKMQAAVANSTQQIISVLQDSNGRISNLSIAVNSEERSRSAIPDVCGNTVGGQTVTNEQLANLTSVLEKALKMGEAKFNELDSDVELYTRKIINSIQELWRTSDELKLDLSHTLEQGSRSREIVRQEFQRLHEQIEPLQKLEPKLSNISEDLDRKVVELSATVDNSFATLLVAQNSFISSCKRIQEEELHIYDILQQIVYEMRNRSVIDVRRISSEIQSQGNQFNNSLTQILAAVSLHNTPTHMLKELTTLIKQKESCVILQTDNISWEVLDALCHRVPKDVTLSSIYDDHQENEMIPESNASLELTPRQFKVSRENLQTVDNETDVNARTRSETSAINMSDYDIDYQLTEADYDEK